MRVLVLGATGKSGRQVVRSLNSIDDVDVDIRPVSRNSPVRFDWDDRTTWAPVVDGVDAMYLIDSQQVDAAQTMTDFTELAYRRGVSHAVLLSSRDVVVSHRPGDAEVVRAVQESGMTWTVLRPTWFMQDFSEWDLFRDSIIEGLMVGTSGAGLEPFVDTRDIGDVAASTLLDRERHAGMDYQLSGPQLFTFGDVAALIGQATHAKIGFEQLADDEFTDYMINSRGVDGELVNDLTMLFGWIREGRNAHVSDGIEKVLGRPPRTFADFARDASAQGVWR